MAPEINVELWICTSLGSVFQDMTVPKKTLEARRYLGVVFSPLMYRYVLAGVQTCLLGDSHAPEDAVTDNADP